MKIVINGEFGGFGLSEEAQKWLNISSYEEIEKLPRNDANLVACVSALGDRVNTGYSKLKIVEIPDDVKDWYVCEFDGLECVREGRTWG